MANLWTRDEFKICYIYFCSMFFLCCWFNFVYNFIWNILMVSVQIERHLVKWNIESFPPFNNLQSKNSIPKLFSSSRANLITSYYLQSVLDQLMIDEHIGDNSRLMYRPKLILLLFLWISLFYFLFFFLLILLFKAYYIYKLTLWNFSYPIYIHIACLSFEQLHICAATTRSTHSNTHP